MEQRFLESKYRDDIIALVLVTMVALTPAKDWTLALICGAFFAFVQRLITVHYAHNSRSKGERVRAVIMFCLYFFLGLWSTDWAGTPLQSIVTSFLFGAAFYQMALWTAFEFAERKDRGRSLTPRQTHQYIVIATLLSALRVAIRIHNGETFLNALGSFSILIVAIAILIMKTNYHEGEDASAVGLIDK